MEKAPICAVRHKRWRKAEPTCDLDQYPDMQDAFSHNDLDVTPGRPGIISWLTGLRISRQKGDRTMSVKKIILALVLLASATTTTLANAPAGAYIQCDGRGSSPLICIPY